jgi:hypothetical protein|tara:strand:+ start:410 stop:904 length:495 start_codon:yes stop_codon:yes gene_type:complete
MAIRKSNDIANETDSKFNKSKGTKKLAIITERFDDTTDNDNPYDDALQYINKKIDECIDAVNTNSDKTVLTIGTESGNAKAGNTTTISTSQASAITANTAKTGISTSQANAITANTAKVGTETDLSVTTGMTLKATVAESRGVYTLTFTVTHGRVTKTADITMS